MTVAVNPTLRVTINGTKSNTTDKEAAMVTLAETIEKAFTSGTADDQVDLMYSDTVTLTTGANVELDLAGVLTDAAFGNLLTFVTVKAIIIHSSDDANKELTVGGAASAAFESWVAAAGDAVKIAPGGVFLLIAPNTGYAVGAGSTDKLKITNASGGSSTFDIFIFGTSA